MKKLISLFAIVLFAAMGTAYSQGWTHLGNFPNDTFMGNTGGHGVAVDPDGKVWITPYGKNDSIFVASTSTWVKCRAIYVFDADGNPVSFSPIRTITVGGLTDTLWNSSLGLREDKDGNILHYTYDALYRINYQSGEGMNKVQPVIGFGGTQPAVADNGNIFTATVLPDNPMQEFTTDFTYIGNVVDASIGYSRTIEVSHDGNTVYWTGFSNNIIYIYSRPDEFSAFALTDSILQGFACESATWSRDGNLLWLSAGNGLNLPNQYPGVTTYYSWTTWYAYDPVTKTLVDSIKWQYNTPGSDSERPRGLAFSPDGRYAYITCFGLSTYPIVQKFEDPNWVSVDEAGQVVVDGYKLSQNYPNPFNPTTKINFELKASGFTTLKVYDMLGNEVATLVNNELTSGTHSVNFNAANLASGTYVYQLNVNGTRITNKMILLK
jgi:hypothetical protein